MENATKALLIAAGLLITIVIISLGLLILGNVSNTSRQADGVSQSLKLASDDAAGVISGSGSNNSSIGREKQEILTIIDKIRRAGFQDGSQTSNAERVLKNPSTNVNSNLQAKAIIVDCKRDDFNDGYDGRVEDITYDFISNIENNYIYGQMQSHNTHASKQFDALLFEENNIVIKILFVFYAG